MKKGLKILVVILIISIIIPTNVFATESSEDTGYQGIDSDFDMELGTSEAANQSEEIINRTLGVFQIIGTIVAVLSLIIIGLRYMLSSIEEKSKIKGVIWYWIVGAMLVLGISQILGVAYNVTDEVNH